MQGKRALHEWMTMMRCLRMAAVEGVIRQSGRRHEGDGAGRARHSRDDGIRVRRVSYVKDG